VLRKFVKMQGCGNDYIYFDCMETELADPVSLAVRLSDRRFGVGGDGIVMICPSYAAAARMRMFNSDGSEGRMCGNAIRCVAKYLYDEGIVPKTEMTIETLSGVKALSLAAGEGRTLTCAVDMGAAEFSPAKIPVALDGDRVVGRLVPVAGGEYRVTCVSMGNPHCVLFVDNPDAEDLPAIGPRFENDPLFPDRVNTEFVRVLNEGLIAMRVWERGSGETLACGTGACAAVAAAAENGFVPKGEDVRVALRGGELTVNYTDERVIMRGSAVKVFEGYIDI
jgi:diaminopimelate epimerase